jgi:Rap1a immunity proteins
MKRALFILFAALPLLGQAAQDSNHDAFTLKRALTANVRESEDNFGAWSYNTGYIQGIADAHDRDAFCLPSNYRAGELSEVVVKYLNDHPTALHQYRGVAVGVALREAYPCKSRQASEQKWELSGITARCAFSLVSSSTSGCR